MKRPSILRTLGMLLVVVMALALILLGSYVLYVVRSV